MECKESTGSCQRDELLSLLADRYRRAIVRYFHASSADVASVSDLAEALSDCDQRDPQRVAARLHHSVLPKLDEADVLEYDSRSTSVRYRGHTALDVLLDALDEL